MPGFKVSRPYTMPKSEARKTAEELAHKIESQLGVRAQWQGDSVTMRGSGVEGKLEISDDVINVSVSLGLVAGMFEGKLKRVVNDYLDEHVT